MDADQTPQEIIRTFVLERAEREPLAARVLLYRALAAVETDEVQARYLSAAADALADADRRAGQFLLDLRRAEPRDRKPEAPEFP
ncbi:hypothetical protein ASA1KI_20970 [Opitutales bacterium ASA1]|uniref:hypothetical protein n=1 Tax=Congregicoccus parvus TaxID=3081749 RepID=UPI002B2F21BA|nr:hypothetical protein ASA1KI_20970 [Opitutales bacterium ASA1]